MTELRKTAVRAWLWGLKSVSDDEDTASRLLPTAIESISLDSTSRNKELEANPLSDKGLNKGEVDVRLLGFRESPANVICGDHQDKLILRQPLSSSDGTIKGEDVADLEWLANCQSVVVNSAKDSPRLLTFIMLQAAAVRRFTCKLVTPVAPYAGPAYYRWAMSAGGSNDLRAKLIMQRHARPFRFANAGPSKLRDLPIFRHLGGIRGDCAGRSNSTSRPFLEQRIAECRRSARCQRRHGAWLLDAPWSFRDGPSAIRAGSPFERVEGACVHCPRLDSSGDFAELLNYRCGAKAYASATAKLRSRGLQSTLVDVLGITEHFQLSVLPKAVKTFDLIKGQGHEEAWLTTVFYRHGLRSLLADRANRSHLEAFSEYSVIEEPVAPAWTEIDTTEIVSAVQQLPPIENAALRLYFGFDGPERTLAEIGAEIGHSEYKARSAIVRGLGRLAVQLGLQGVFDQREAAILRLTLVDGASLANAAKVLGISYAEARGFMLKWAKVFDVA